ncbi:MAG TPA: NUDIX hydrolase [Propionibacteriaceae bacterium]|nr:NUDIX hydrolase [Propionibacteriaceae bacterium]
MTADSLRILQRLAPAVPDALARRVEAWTAADRPVQAAPSASVVLVRDRGGLEVYLMQRHARMPFAPSMVVFPGGRVDAVDAAHPAGAIRGCALRETLEETGVQLADDDLLPWAHWITPEPEPRRFDTEFFAAVLPPGQDPADISGETDRAGWSSPEDALAAVRRGDFAMMPPTLSIVMELAEAGNVSAVLDAARDRIIRPVLPQVINDHGHWVFRYPQSGDAEMGSRRWR